LKKYRYIYASELKSEEKLFDDLDGIFRDHGISGRPANNIRLGISEAFTNAMLHGNDADVTKSVELRVEVNAGVLTADIIDEGHGNPEAVSGKSLPGLWQENGRGIALIEIVCDDVGYGRNEATGGLQVTLTFRLTGKRKEHGKLIP